MMGTSRAEVGEPLESACLSAVDAFTEDWISWATLILSSLGFVAEKGWRQLHLRWGGGWGASRP